MPVVNYQGKNTHKLTARIPASEDNRGGSIKYMFVPGANEVPLDIWEGLLEYSQGCQNMVDNGLLKPVALRPERKAGSRSGSRAKALDTLDDADIGRTDVYSAVTLIESVVDLEHLMRFEEQEKTRRGGIRKQVKAALDARIAAVREADGLKERETTPAPNKEPEESGNVGIVNATTAIEMVEAAESIEELTDMSEQEKNRKGGPRKSVIAAFDSRLEDLSSPDDTGGDDTGGDGGDDTGGDGGEGDGGDDDFLE